jgi:xanthosine utilization system XapX-like protein
MATASPPVIALVSGYLGLKGESVMVLAGEVFDRNHPLVKQYPHLFGAQPVRESRVEQATAAPGEKRGA